MPNVGKYVFQQLESLSKREREEFLDNIKLFSGNKTLITLARLVFREAKKKNGEWQGPKGEDLENWLWKAMGKAGKYKRNTLSTDFNRLKIVIDHFYAYLYLRKSPTEMRLAALREYGQRDCNDLVSSQISAVRKSINETDLMAYLRQVELALLEGEYLVEGLKRKKNKKLADFLHVLSEARRFLNEAWEVGGSMLETMSVHASFLFNEPLQPEENLHERSVNPTSVLYQKLTNVIRNWYKNDRLPTSAELKELREIRRSLFDSEEYLSAKDSFQLYMMLIALLVPLINHKVEGASEEFLQTQRYAYQKGYLEEDGKMDAKTFKTLIEFSLKYKDVEFAGQMIERYGNRASLALKDDQGREDVTSIEALLNYVQASRCLVTGEYHQALKLSNLSGLEDSLFVYSQRWVEIQACYYLKDYDLCISRITAFEKVLRHNIKKNIYYQAELYKIKISHFKRLVVALLETEVKKARILRKLEEDLRTGKSFTGMDWILEELAKVRKSDS